MTNGIFLSLKRDMKLKASKSFTFLECIQYQNIQNIIVNN
jgi:hypothetical protein